MVFDSGLEVDLGVKGMAGCAGPGSENPNYHQKPR